MKNTQILELTQEQLMNKLFCSFTTKEGLDVKLQEINRQYKIMYGKIFVLESPESDEYMCTYNIELDGTTAKILANTILLHRKKESNTLYTINSLNLLIKQLNGGVLNTAYQINWQDYKNSILLTQGEELRKMNTSIHKIVSV